MAAPDIEERDHYTFVRIAMSKYKHAHDPKRVINWHRFAWQIKQLDRRINGKPDVVYYSSPSLPGYLGAEALARKTGAKLLFEERDLWPLSLIEIGKKSPSHPFVRWLQYIEDRAYRNADVLLSNAEGVWQHIQERGFDKDKFTWLPNGISIDEVANPEPVDLNDQFDRSAPGFKIGYVGTMGSANKLHTLLSAAHRLSEQKDVHFYLAGNGREKQNLLKRVCVDGMRNVDFLKPVQKSQVQSLLQCFDALVICCERSPLYRVGIAANKIPEYMYAGRPIINCFSGEFDPIERFKCGLSVEADNPTELANAILKLKALSQEERDAMGARGRQAAEEHYDYAKIAMRLEGLL